MGSRRRDAAAQESGQGSGGKGPDSESKQSSERKGARGYFWKRLRGGLKRHSPTPPRQEQNQEEQDEQDQQGQDSQDCQEHDGLSITVFPSDQEEETTLQIRAERGLPGDPDFGGNWWVDLWLVGYFSDATLGEHEEWEEPDIDPPEQNDGPFSALSKTLLGRLVDHPPAIQTGHARLYWERRIAAFEFEEGVAGLLADGCSLLLVCNGAHNPDSICPRLIRRALKETSIGDGWMAHRFGPQNYLVRMPSREAAEAAVYTLVHVGTQSFFMLPYVPELRAFYVLDNKYFSAASLVEAICDALPGRPFYASQGTRGSGHLIVVLIYFARAPGIRKAILPVPRLESRKSHSQTPLASTKRESSVPSDLKLSLPTPPPSRSPSRSPAPKQPKPYLVWLTPLLVERRCPACCLRHPIGHCHDATTVESPFTLVDNPMTSQL
ncbi:MAG: hypothetical protein M1815_000911 [Lichina confinis]|nr:MAG: hypothetical protein M1815_000911 [Lichina confinis]